MSLEIPKEYLSTFNRQIQTQLYNELRHDYSFPRAVYRSLYNLFTSYLDLYFSSQRKEGQIIFHAISKDVPPGVPVEEMYLIPVETSLYETDDCPVKNQQDLPDKRIIRISNDAYNQTDTGELYLKVYEYTDIKRKTKHTGECIMRYVKDFARIMVLSGEGQRHGSDMTFQPKL